MVFSFVSGRMGTHCTVREAHEHVRVGFYVCVVDPSIRRHHRSVDVIRMTRARTTMSPSLAPMRRANASIDPRRFMPSRLARSSATSTTLRAVESTTRESTREDDEDDTARDDDRASSSTSRDDRRDAFSSLERALADAARLGNASSDARGWERVDDAYALRPRDGRAPRCVVHFCGGAFVGASPQVTYGEFCETLVERGDALVIATPTRVGLDHLRAADEAWQKYERCARALRKTVDGYDDLPVYGIGHSLGALVTVLIGSRYETRRDGNVLMSFNNRPATDAIPLFAELFAPGLQGLSPIIDAASKSPLRSLQRNADAQLREFAPPLIKELLPILDNLEPVILEIADGRAEFTPTPEESSKMVQKYYAVRKNLLIKFVDDSIDETSDLAATLAGAEAAEDVDLTVRAKPGDHVFPLWRDTGIDVPDEVYEVAEQGGDMLAAFGDAFGLKADDSPLGLLREGFDNARRQAREARTSRDSSGDRERMDALVDEIIAWM